MLMERNQFDTTDCEHLMTDIPDLKQMGKSALKAVELLDEEETAPEIPEWKAYVDQFTDEELVEGVSKSGEAIDFSKLNNTAESFRVDPDDYPIFNTQTVLKTARGENERWNIDRILSEYIGFTANTIAAMDGSTEKPKTDVAIYLDKSARPVEKFVHGLWNDFAKTDKETGEIVSEPEAAFLNIDRLVWMRRVDINVDDRMYLVDDPKVRASYNDFKRKVEQDGFKKEDLAAIRALFIEGGRTTDDLDEIMRTPTKLDGKNITIIDEVSDTGATINIAKDILAAAIPEIASINGHVFANFGSVINTDDGTSQMASSPVWYPSKDHSYQYGREVLDPSYSYWEEEYKNNPTPENYAKLKAYFIISTPMNLEEEPERRTLELYREINQLVDEFHQGKILFRPGAAMEWQMAGDNGDRAYAKILRQGINVAGGNYQKIAQQIESRPPIDYFSTEFPVH